MTAQHTRRKSDADQDKSANQQIRTPKFYKSGSPISSSGHPNSTFQIRTIKYWSKYELRTSNILESMDTHRFGQTRAPNSATRRIPPIRTSSTWTSTAARIYRDGQPGVWVSSFVQFCPTDARDTECPRDQTGGAPRSYCRRTDEDTQRFRQTRAPDIAPCRIQSIQTASTWTSSAARIYRDGQPGVWVSSFVQFCPTDARDTECPRDQTGGAPRSYCRRSSDGIYPIDYIGIIFNPHPLLSCLLFSNLIY